MTRGRVLLAAAAALGAFAAIRTPSLATAAFLLAISLTAILGLLRHLARRPSRRPLVPPGGSVLEQAEARVGQPIQLLCPFELRAQDRPGERWQGSQPMWLALGEQTLWFLHDATLGRLGGVWDALPRQGLHILSTGDRHSHDVELSWPLMPRLLIGSLTGPTADRERLLGLLAADELGLRDLLDPGH